MRIQFDQQKGKRQIRLIPLSESDQKMLEEFMKGICTMRVETGSFYDPHEMFDRFNRAPDICASPRNCLVLEASVSYDPETTPERPKDEPRLK